MSTTEIDMKKCGGCEQEKPLSEFPYLKTRASYYYLCFMCRKTYHRNHYHNGYQKKRGEITKAASSRTKALVMSKVLDYLLSNPCVDCGETDPVVLDFDHVRGVKSRNISDMTRGGYVRWEKVQEEILKCDVRCANCHRRKTAKQLGWKNKMPQSFSRQDPSL